MNRSPSVLYVDDDHTNLKAIQYAFEDEFDIRIVDSGERALSMLEGNDVDVLLCDQRMPGMSGVELCQRAREASPRTVRILYTAYADAAAATAAINEGGVARLVHKPASNEELREVIFGSFHQAAERAEREMLTSVTCTDTTDRVRAAVGKRLATRFGASLPVLWDLLREGHAASDSSLAAVRAGEFELRRLVVALQGGSTSRTVDAHAAAWRALGAVRSALFSDLELTLLGEHTAAAVDEPALVQVLALLLTGRTGSVELTTRHEAGTTTLDVGVEASAETIELVRSLVEADGGRVLERAETVRLAFEGVAGTSRAAQRSIRGGMFRSYVDLLVVGDVELPETLQAVHARPEDALATIPHRGPAVLVVDASVAGAAALCASVASRFPEVSRMIVTKSGDFLLAAEAAGYVQSLVGASAVSDVLRESVASSKRRRHRAARRLETLTTGALTFRSRHSIELERTLEQAVDHLIGAARGTPAESDVRRVFEELRD